MPFSKEQMNEYRALRCSNQVAYIHCQECFGQKPVDQSPEQWSRIELIIDTATGNAYAGCARCELPIIMDEKGKVE
jgi:hypothetical protein